MLSLGLGMGWGVNQRPKCGSCAGAGNAVLRGALRSADTWHCLHGEPGSAGTQARIALWPHLSAVSIDASRRVAVLASDLRSGSGARMAVIEAPKLLEHGIWPSARVSAAPRCST